VPRAWVRRAGHEIGLLGGGADAERSTTAWRSRSCPTGEADRPLDAPPGFGKDAAVLPVPTPSDPFADWPKGLIAMASTAESIRIGDAGQ
jgi:hypothetical protein